VILALIAKFVLHEQVTMLRWVGIGLIAVGVSFVASGPELTHSHPPIDDRVPELAGYRGER
jgi:drug/metabolite transporter (DMT)-like permease